ncbi:MAG: rRNA maturation RNase YbeY [bacterium]|nr:rRNA maturation RNase YbeY [bacterium]
MMSVTINTVVKIPWSKISLEQIVRLASRHEKRIKGEVEINIIGDKEIKKLNQLYRQQNKITDVLSFAWQEDDCVDTNTLGQIYISFPQIKRQAEVWGVTVKEELARILIHGLLHLVGYDHQEKKDEKIMFRLQEDVVEKCKDIL